MTPFCVLVPCHIPCFLSRVPKEAAAPQAEPPNILVPQNIEAKEPKVLLPQDTEALVCALPARSWTAAEQPSLTKDAIVRTEWPQSVFSCRAPFHVPFAHRNFE